MPSVPEGLKYMSGVLADIEKLLAALSHDHTVYAGLLTSLNANPLVFGIYSKAKLFYPQPEQILHLKSALTDKYAQVVDVQYGGDNKIEVVWTPELKLVWTPVWPGNWLYATAPMTDWNTEMYSKGTAVTAAKEAALAAEVAAVVKAATPPKAKKADKEVKPFAVKELKAFTKRLPKDYNLVISSKWLVVVELPVRIKPKSMMLKELTAVSKVAKNSFTGIIVTKHFETRSVNIKKNKPETK